MTLIRATVYKQEEDAQPSINLKTDGCMTNRFAEDAKIVHPKYCKH